MDVDLQIKIPSKTFAKSSDSSSQVIEDAVVREFGKVLRGILRDGKINVSNEVLSGSVVVSTKFRITNMDDDI